MQQLYYKLELTEKRSSYSSSYIPAFEMENML